MKLLKHKWGRMLLLSGAVSLLSVSCLIYLVFDMYGSGTTTLDKKEISEFLEINLSDEVKVISSEYLSSRAEKLKVVLEVPSEEFENIFSAKAKSINEDTSIGPKKYKKLLKSASAKDVKSFRYKQNDGVVDVLYYKPGLNRVRVCVRWTRLES